MAKLNFDPGAADRREAPGPMPAGEYLFAITGSDIRPGARPGSQVLKLTYACLAEGYEGRPMWQHLNLVHPNAEAQRLAHGELREICEAQGRGHQVLDDSARLHGTPMLVRIEVERDGTNRPTGWRSPQFAVAMAQPQPLPATAVRPPPSGPDTATRPVPPWMKRA